MRQTVKFLNFTMVLLLVFSIVFTVSGIAFANYTGGEVYSKEDRGYGIVQKEGDNIYGFGYQEVASLGQAPVLYGEPFKLDYRAKITKFELGNSGKNEMGPGFWLRASNGTVYKFTSSNTINDVFALVLPAGEYYVFPEVEKGEVSNTIEIEFIIIEKGGTVTPVPTAGPSGDLSLTGVWKVIDTNGFWYSVMVKNESGNTYKSYVVDAGSAGNKMTPYLAGQPLDTLEYKGNGVYEGVTGGARVAGQTFPSMPVTLTLFNNAQGADSRSRTWTRLQ